MDIPARSYLTAGVSLLAASAIALAPLPLMDHHPVSVTTADIRLVASPSDTETAVDELQSALLSGTAQLAAAAGVPGEGLIGVVDNIVTMWDVLFTRLMNATSDPTQLGSLAILKPFCVDAFATLAHNLGRINAVITGTTAQVGDLLTMALTGSLRNVLVAGVAAANAPLAPASYAGLLAAGIETGSLLVGNGLGVVQAVGDAGFDIGGIVVDELTFQLNNALGSLGRLMTQLGDASGSGVARVVVAAVRGLAFAPALAVFNFGSQAIKAVIATAKGAFDAVVGIGSSPAGSTTASAVRSVAIRKPLAHLPLRAVATRAEKAAAKAGPAANKTSSRKTSTSEVGTRTPATGHSGRSVRGSR
ncbi:hypothetical protein MHPYR_30104 [uncultured Mycobacterium sp.]|uniref:Uncharacterized protein n=1 Tax=uncultured Mycobacterium sp. TaxID=171292 RepID=A0A1Y5PBR9_9MYCO|nr:hypothetical protein MHPYR_30104 [uncultured Mycobacterium sp.]